MVNPISLKAVNQRIDELIRQYDTLGLNDRRGPDTIEELSQLNVVRDELEKVHGKVQTDRVARFMIPDAEFPTLEALYSRMDSLAQQIAETPRDDPCRPDIVNELTCLSMLAHSVKTHPADA